MHSAVIIEDHPIMARGIADLLRMHCGTDETYTLSHPDQLWHFLEHHDSPSLVIIDFCLFRNNELNLLSRLRQHSPNTKQLVITAEDSQIVHTKIRTSLADGVLLKQQSPEIFIQAVKALNQGKRWCLQDNTFSDTRIQNTVPNPEKLGLTVRQAQALEMLLQGLPNKHIAQGLQVTESTVKEHVSTILSKLQVNTRMEAITKLHRKQLAVGHD